MPMTSRQDALAEREAAVGRLRNMPEAMRALPQWLAWKLETVPGRNGLQKVPYYINGKKRRGDPGSAEDRAGLATFDAALARFAGAMHFTGLGFAFLKGDGLVAVDLDHVHDESGAMADHFASILEVCSSYTELSPSGNGLHIILAGDCDSFKHDPIGVEVYCGGRYFTCTGRRFGDGPAQVQPLKPYALAYLRELVQTSKDKERKARDGRAEPAADGQHEPASFAEPAPAPAVQRTGGTGQAGNDFKRVNDAAHQQLQAWVPQVFSVPRAWRDGYRIRSADMGRGLEEDLQITPEGIYDFGERIGMSPIDVVIKWVPSMARPADALHWLAQRLGVALTPLRMRRPAPPATAGGGADARPGDDAEAVAQGETSEADNVVPLDAKRPPPPPLGGRAAAAVVKAPKGPDKKVPAETWELVDGLCLRFALVYGSDTAWDRLELMLIKVSAMRLAFGKTAVNLWLTRPTREMVRPIDLVFEPGEQVAPPLINMYAGLDLEPRECTAEAVAPMLNLLRHLCGESLLVNLQGGTAGEVGNADDVDAVMHWILRWQALPVQRPGTKMETACVFHGAQGTGKNLYWDIWRDLFGEYGITVGQTELEDKFNGWISRKLAIIGDEVVSRQEMYHNKNRLKLVVSQKDKFPIRGMQMETRWESNHANVVFLSNESQPLALEERDRRYLVVYTPLEADNTLYEAVRVFKAGGGAAKWLWYLQHYPIGEFSTHTKPLMTKAKQELIEAAWKPPARFGFEWLEGYLELPLRVCSAEQLYRAFRRWCELTGAKWPPDQAGFTSELNRWVRESVKRGGDGRLEAPRLHYKQVALKDPSVRRRTVRCWLPVGTGPADGKSEGEWAWESVAAFEQDLYRYVRPRGSLGGDDE
jgi:hypothetical protein